MRTVKEIEVDLFTVGAEVVALDNQLRAAKAQQQTLWTERKTAEAALEVVKLPPQERDEYIAKVEAEEAAKPEPAPEEPAEPAVEG